MEDRLNTLEQKIDKLTEVVVTLARIEEKVSQIIEDKSIESSKVKELSATVHKLESELQAKVHELKTEITTVKSDLVKKIHTLETEQASRKYIERVVWVVISIAIAGLLGGKFLLGK